MVRTFRHGAAVVAACVLSFGVSAAVRAAQQQGGKETALHHTAQDPKLSWGGCPEFMPKGCAIAVLHGDPAKPNADVFFKVPAGAQIPRHHHTSAERMVLVSGEMTVTYDGQAPVTLRQGAYAYGPAQAPHSATCAQGASPCVLFIAFEGPVDAVAGAPAAK